MMLTRIFPFFKISPYKDCIWGISPFHNFNPQPWAKFSQNGVISPNLATLPNSNNYILDSSRFVSVLGGGGGESSSTIDIYVAVP